jgi:hypothetical protein
MAGREHQAQEIIANIVIDHCFEIRYCPFLPGVEIAADLLVFLLEPLVSAEEIDRTVLRGGHEPGARIVRNSRIRPLLECRNKSVLREILGKPDIADDVCQAGDEPRRFNPPDCVDGAMRIGSCHCYRSHHLPICQCKAAALPISSLDIVAALIELPNLALPITRHAEELLYLFDRFFPGIRLKHG